MTDLKVLPPSRLKDRLYGLLIIAVAFSVCTGASLWAKEMTVPKAARPPAPRTKEGLSDYPERVRPFSVLQSAAARTDRPLFVGMKVDNVEGDGTLNFTKSKTQLRFVFQSPPNRGAQPAREGGRLPRYSYCGKQEVSLTKDGLGEKVDRIDTVCGSKDPVALKLPESCLVADVMQVLNGHKKQVSSARVRLEYFNSKAGPAYAVYRSGKKMFTLLAADCTTKLTRKLARGRVP